MDSSESEDASWLELLPMEVITVIASYLTAREVVQCCATNSTMRDIFGDDCIWRPRCRKELVEPLKKTRHKISPVFKIPTMENSMLSPLAEWRLSYLRENHLWNNWRKGKFLRERVDFESPLADFYRFYNDDYVLAKYSDRVEFWDVGHYPASNAAESIYFGTKNSSNLKIVIVKDMIVFLVGSGVQVFEPDLNLKKFQLKRTFFFEKSITAIDCGLHEERSIFDVPERQFQEQCLTVGRFLVGVLEGESTMHIWNLETGLKLKEEACPLKYCEVLQMEASDTTRAHLVLAVGKAMHVETKTLLVYSLTKLKFLPFNETININSEYSAHKDYIVTRFMNIFQVFNYQTSTTLATMPTESFPKVVKNNLLFMTDTGIQVFNLIEKTSKPIYTDYLTNFEVFGDKFILIEGRHNLFLWYGNIWEIDESCEKVKLTEMRFDDFQRYQFVLNKSYTRCVFRKEKGCILNFW